MSIDDNELPYCFLIVTYVYGNIIGFIDSIRFNGYVHRLSDICMDFHELSLIIIGFYWFSLDS